MLGSASVKIPKEPKVSQRNYEFDLEFELENTYSSNSAGNYARDVSPRAGRRNTSGGRRAAPLAFTTQIFERRSTGSSPVST